ncbi:MAG TPA: bifunctional hydroxymethylpyrimidine kinase/phosphomethylpyrimidine kinase [Tahibacter sp.]|uniref:bifunctional hydroxymethylpyrimidine kinase/phosphomethylpyrimidine kinase n=1 Tax=Tahibacter sp. TaxID=2056211 RepID=UPI002D186531|nr:bifunctional hydroxymethylpyrimidine kinase/phosphomethylpyrimidine kinase [Tahibacter sp.]HSX61203.1 bifunctional hydroxymethylpyrimidine kinase/phosphomethylpyrimidine kinase [Tahibacter sp.]
MPTSTYRPCVLTVAGSDSGGGAGIQADLKTFHAHGVHGASVLTAVTAQNTRAVTAVLALPPRMIRAQIDAVRDDFAIAAWKTGMLADARTIRAIARGMRDAGSVYVMDPVMIATSGASLLEDSAVSALRAELLPRARLVTPNLPEAAALSGRPIRRSGDIDRVAADLIGAGAGAVLVKGGHQRGADVVDRLYCDGKRHEFVHRRLARNGHGTGCTLAAAITANLALGFDLIDACARATDYVHAALDAAYRPGRSTIDVLDHGVAVPARRRRRAGR